MLLLFQFPEGYHFYSTEYSSRQRLREFITLVVNWDFEVAMFGTQFLQQMESVPAQLF